MIRERIERFFKNLASALGHCILGDLEILPVATLAFTCMCFLFAFWVIGVVVYDLMLDPHFTTASIKAVSIRPDKWPT